VSTPVACRASVTSSSAQPAHLGIAGHQLAQHPGQVHCPVHQFGAYQ
jgi:hypothetical protein